jgi:hypothetical protein
VHETGDLLRRQAPIGLHALERLQHREAGVVAGARDLHDPGRPVGAAHDHVGKRAADIDPDEEIAARAHAGAHAPAAYWSVICTPAMLPSLLRRLVADRHT